MKYLIFKKTTLIIGITFCLLAIIVSLPFGQNCVAGVFFGETVRKIPVYCVSTGEKQVAISFDAAWGADKTEKIMDLLDEYNVSATFFLVGFWVEKFPDLVTAIENRGFEIGTHSNTHPDMTKLTAEQMESELQTSIDLIENLTTKDVKLFRAPYGSYNNQLLTTAEKLGLQTIQWDVDSLDWKGISGAEISGRVVNKVKNGSIILCHNNSDHILDALPIIFDRLKNQGYTITCVGDLIYKDNFIIDHTGLQKSNSA